VRGCGAGEAETAGVRLALQIAFAIIGAAVLLFICAVILLAA
jgi:hypothetical protein